MLVKAEMKNKKLYMGLKCGSENGFLYLVNPIELTEDEKHGGYLETPVGEEIYNVSVVLLPIQDIETITSAQ